MSWIQKFLTYHKDNPEGYWFKAKLYGFGWMPVKWQGWLVVIVYVAIVSAGAYIGETDDAPSMTLIGLALGIALLIIFCYWKGEKPRWQWGPPDKHETKKSN